MLRWVLGAVVCLIVGIMFLARYFSGVPALEQLTKVEGPVTSAEVETRQSRRSTSQLLAVQVGDAPRAFYSSRFPDYERVVVTIKPGDRVTAWVDVGGNNYIWQLEKDGERLASYDQVAEVQRSNDRNNALFGILFLVVGLGILGSQLWQFRARSRHRPKDEEESREGRGPRA
jgi:hypothetical protein